MTQESEHSKVLLPSMGEGVIEATVNKWLKSPGDKVAKDEPLLEVSTDKVDTEIASTHSGYLIETFAKSGDVVKVGALLAQVSESKDAAVVFKAEEIQSVAVGTSAKSSQPRSAGNQPAPGQFAMSNSFKSLAGPVSSSPLVRKMARDYNVNLANVEGTGAWSRVTKQDLLGYLHENSPASEEKSTPALVTEHKEEGEFLEGVLVKREPMSKIRELTARHMVQSVRTSPHVTTTFEINLESALKFKKEQGEAFQKDHGVKLTLTPLFINACVEALKQHPYVNASIDGYDILLKEDINIACAVATDDGLLVPVMKKLQNKSFAEMVVEFQELVNKTRDKRLQPSDLKGGTFSVTNPGMYGSLHSQPIINQPQVAILSVGAITQRCMLVDDKPMNQSFCQIGLTFDHRIIDGQGGAYFLQTVKRVLEEGGYFS